MTRRSEYFALWCMIFGVLTLGLVIGATAFGPKVHIKPGDENATRSMLWQSREDMAMFREQAKLLESYSDTMERMYGLVVAQDRMIDSLQYELTNRH